jgi:hypothetical protein
MRAFVTFVLAATAAVMSLPAAADTLSYTFVGVFNGPGQSQAYTGRYTIIDPVGTANPPVLAGISTWSYSGGGQLEVTFASGTVVSAPVLYITISENRNAVLGNGSPQPLGLAMQVYTNVGGGPADGVTVTAPTQPVCATPTGVCGPDDDPLYHDGTQDQIMSIAGVYLAFYNATLPAAPGPLPGAPGLPSVGSFGGAGLGVYVPGIVDQGTQLYNTTLTSFGSISEHATTSAVPEPSGLALLSAGALVLLWRARRVQSR